MTNIRMDYTADKANMRLLYKFEGVHQFHRPASYLLKEIQYLFLSNFEVLNPKIVWKKTLSHNIWSNLVANICKVKYY